MSEILDSILKKGNDYDKSESPSPKESPSKSHTKEYLDRLEESGYDLTDMRAVFECTGNQLIIAGAGSGKTTTLELKILYDFINGRMFTKDDFGNLVLQHVWVGTFLRNGKIDLYKRLKSLSKFVNYPLINRIRISTLHSEFLQACEAMGIHGNLITDRDNRRLFNQAASTVKYSSMKEEVDDLYGRTTKIRGSMQMSTSEMEVMTEWKRLRRSKGLLDFEDMQESLYTLAVLEENQEVIDYLRSRYNRIYLDEFQDVSRIQYELIRVYGRGKGIGGNTASISDDRLNGAVLAIGDDDQSIYSWRGSDIDFITKRFPEDFNATLHKSTLNYRTPEGILNAVVGSIEQNTNRYDKELKAAKPGGELYYCRSHSYNTMIKMLEKRVSEDINNGSKVAVLVRTNSDGLMPALGLVSKGIPVSLSSPEMTLNGAMGSSTINVISLILGHKTNEAYNAITDITSVCGFSSWKASKQLKDWFYGSRESFWNIDHEDLKFSMPKMYDSYIEWQKAYEYDMKNGGNVTIGTALRVLNFVYSYLLKSKPTNWNIRKTSLYSSIISLANEYGADEPLETLWVDLSDLKSQLSASYSTNRGVSLADSCVDIGTVHDYKGREADSVYIWNDSQGVFPLNRVISTDFQAGLEEERRIHYIACTRAKEKETIFTLNGKESEFFNELDLSGATELNESESLTDYTGSKVIGKTKTVDEDEIEFINIG